MTIHPLFGTEANTGIRYSGTALVEILKLKLLHFFALTTEQCKRHVMWSETVGLGQDRSETKNRSWSCGSGVVL